METDTSLGACRLKVGGDAADANTHDDLLAWTCERRYFLLQEPGTAQAEPMASLLVCGGRRDPWLRAPRSVAVPGYTAGFAGGGIPMTDTAERKKRSEEHTSELQSQSNLVCRLLLEKKKDDAVVRVDVLSG